jgi:hypothetical protein
MSAMIELLADTGANKQKHLDSGSDPPGFFPFEAKGGEGMGKRHAEAKPVK